ncbi:ABC transporter permease [Paenibacillus silvae]|uniref:ABC transporter permease n=1 Tax=Paenibacillus silvae TaxID=1325358 RepID=UPI002005E8A9|nr:ABC transporter permease [Paenibacillus silvae]MCK6078652.1 ABC transporter permease [Paenibacillus silvae]MCK6152971.1 ABC transporter permease [Paenibacillus silvae]MCK6271481.1 ABC transporter permease [Paenibacillus silvae]
MLKLIRLEWRKHRFARNLTGAGIAMLSILLFLIMIGVTDLGAEDYAFASYEDSFILIDTFARAVFIIFSGALISKLIISEYRDKTMNVMFTYPIKRHKIIAAKLMLIFLFTFAMIMLTDAVMGVLLLTANHLYDFITEPMSTAVLWKMIVKYIISAFSASAMALIPLFFGMRKHSVTATMVASILLVFVVCSGFNGPTFSVNSIIVIPLTLGAIGLWIAALSMIRLETKDMS